ncbi:hypothetical protein [Chitinophaga nivalis]|uniref:ABC transporter permease n=1 Tax=Chitinophaga nivalis TaxID=2991709 RepID=A0ABT3ITP6_9BACT|nr:hypothetical protein [Chitinophaga nivalis]MCW3462958.1 hypothetical protein [Chitinophaga nivalis]MCW3487352.1 hypothetical protein [Chitinophaga nivalis]
MKQNNFFDLHRMQLYLQKHFTETYRFYLLATGSLVGIMIMVPILMMTLGKNDALQLIDLAPTYYIGLFGGGLLFTGRSFGELGNKEKCVDYLLLPASQFEKFITLLFTSTIGFLVVYHLAFYTGYLVADAIQFSVQHQHIQTNYTFLSDPDEKTYVYYCYFILQALFLLGATYYHKYSFIKTLLSIFIFLFGMAMLNCVFLFCLFGTEKSIWKRGVPFVMINVLDPKAAYSWTTTTYVIPQWLRDIYLFAIRFLIAPAIWTIAYFRLKDKEI